MLGCIREKPLPRFVFGIKWTRDEGHSGSNLLFGGEKRESREWISMSDILARKREKSSFGLVALFSPGPLSPNECNFASPQPPATRCRPENGSPPFHRPLQIGEKNRGRNGSERIYRSNCTSARANLRKLIAGHLLEPSYPENSIDNQLLARYVIRHCTCFAVQSPSWLQVRVTRLMSQVLSHLVGRLVSCVLCAGDSRLDNAKAFFSVFGV